MDSRDYNEGYSKRVKVNKRSSDDKDEVIVKDEIIEEEKEEEEKPSFISKKAEEYKPKTVRLALQKNKKVRVFGSVTGAEYFFNGAGTELDVDERDVPQLLEKGINQKSCCSGVENSPYFVIVEN